MTHLRTKMFAVIAAFSPWFNPAAWSVESTQGSHGVGLSPQSSAQESDVAANASSELPTGVIVNQTALNGLFYDAERPGHGLDFNQHEYGLTIYYYGHTDTGQRLWLLSETYKQEVKYGEPLDLEMFEVLNGTFGNPDPMESVWGTLTLTMKNCNSGSASLNGRDGALQIDFSRLVGLEGFSCESRLVSEMEPNEDSSAAQGFRPGETIAGNLSDIDDVDWYAVDIAGSPDDLAYVDFDVSQVNDGEWSVDWYDPNMQILSGKIISAPEGSRYEFPASATGRYFLRLGSENDFSFSGATYNITMDSTSLPPDTPAPTPQVGQWSQPANGNEHGDAPPQWATDWSMAAFGHGVVYGGDEQTPNEWINKPRAFKGQLVYSFDYTTGQTRNDGSEGYFRYHGQANAAGRCTRYHSFELYWRDSSGNVTFLQGQGDFGNPADARFPRADGDPSERPAMLVNDVRSPELFEQWYGHSPYVDYGVAIGTGTTHYETDECATLPDLGVPTGNYGLTRLVDGVLYENRLPFNGWFCSSPRWYQDGEGTSSYNTTTGACDNPDHIPQYVAPTLNNDMYFYYLNRVDFRSQRSFSCGGACSLPN